MHTHTATLLFFSSFRIGIPTATLYYSYSLGYWATGNQQKIQPNDPLALAAKDAVSKAWNQVEPYTEPYKSEWIQKWNNLRIAKLWNCGVKWTFGHLSRFDPSAQAKVLYEKALKSLNEPGAK